MTDIDRMARMWNIEGLSQSEIAAHFGMSRHAVAGLIFRHREKFKRRNQGQRTDVRRERAQAAAKAAKPAPATKPREPIATASQKANERRKAFHAVKVAEEAKAAPVEIVEPEIDDMEYDAGRLPMAKELIDLEPCHCRWPLTDIGPHLFCCAEVVTGSPYCAHHRKRSKGRGTESERKALDVLKRAA